MIKIERTKINRNNLILQLICGILIVGSYFTTRMLVFGAGVLAMGYLFSAAKWEQKFSMFMFLLSFSVIFKYPGIDTSLFMFLRVAIVFSYAFQNRKKFDFSFLFLAITFFAFCVFVSEINKTDYLVSTINIVLWIMIGYVFVNTVTIEKATPVIRGFSNSIILTGIVGLFIESLPQLMNAVGVSKAIAEDGAYISRHAGFFDDPNYFTIMVISSLWFIYYEFNNNKIKVTEFLTRISISSFLGLMTMSKSCMILLVIFWVYILLVKNHIKLAAKVVIFFGFVIALLLFISLNPYWISDMLYRFSGGNNDLNASVLTTGRSDLWGSYIEKMLGDYTWILGNGVNAKLITEAGAHNNIIQIVYCIGLAGAILYTALFVSVYNSAKTTSSKPAFNGPEKYAFLSLLAAMFFLDGMTMEPYYYMMAVSFLYMLGTRGDKTEGEYLTEESTVEI